MPYDTVHANGCKCHCINAIYSVTVNEHTHSFAPHYSSVLENVGTYKFFLFGNHGNCCIVAA